MKYDNVIKDRSFKGNPKIKGDSNALGVSWRPGQPTVTTLIQDCTIDANGAAEGLKLSYAHNVTVRHCHIIGGYEDCVDIVRGTNILFDNCVFEANNTKHHFTIKCMVDGVTITNCVFRNNFNHVWDGAMVDMGNWGDYDVEDLPKTRNLRIENCTLQNISWWKRILTRRLYAENVSSKNTAGFNLKIPSIFVKLFWRYKRWQASRK